MNEGYKAKEAEIILGTVLIKVFQLPNGEYRLSQSEVANAIGKRPRSIYEFVEGKSSEALPHKGFDFTNSLAVEVSNKPITPITIGLATAYWRYWDKRNNRQATAIIDGCITEAIERRADAAFGVYRTEEEYNQRIQAAEMISYDGVEMLRQVQGLIEIVKANVDLSREINRTIHTLMHNQATALKATHGQATALLDIIKRSNEVDGSTGADKRLEEMEKELQLLNAKIDKLIPSERNVD